MEKPVVSLVASANRIEWWMRFYESLKNNTIPFEVVFVGNVQPNFTLPDNFRFFYATVKPAQCYEYGFRMAKGEFIHWTADDASYNYRGPLGECPNPLDRAVTRWRNLDAKHGNDKKSVIAFRPIEDGGDVWNFHHFFGGWPHTPMMAPFVLINREYFVNHLGGYDRRFVSGQSENDVIMRVYEDGGRLEVAHEAMLYVHHRQVHPRDPYTGKEDNKFRKWYNTDRDVLESFWVIGGRGWYEKLNALKDGQEKEQAKREVPLSPKRLLPLEKFEDGEDFCTVTQGLKGHWQ